MTLVAYVTRIIRRYISNTEVLFLLMIFVVLYNAVFHARPIWRYLQHATLKTSNKTTSSEYGPVSFAAPEKSNAAWDMKKNGVAVYAVQGRRLYMEDRFNIVTKLEHTNTSIFGIFDGHGGEVNNFGIHLDFSFSRQKDQFSSDFTEKTLFKRLMIRLLKASLDNENINHPEILTQEILNVDNTLLELLRSQTDMSGSTALVALMKNMHLTVANVGDSRGVMCDRDGRSIPLSYDHKPHQMKEKKRIKESGGFISFNGVWRVGGVLATSRALGDYPLKDKNMIIAEPEILTFNLKDLQPQFLILATDGLWDVFGNQEAVDFIKERLHEPHFGAKSLVLQAYYRGSQDNISVMVINLKHFDF